MSHRRPATEFWQSVVLRLIVIWLLGCTTILWFQGCLVPAAREEMRQNHLKSAGPDLPSR